MPKFDARSDRPETMREEVVRALLHSDRAQYDELGRTLSLDANGDPESHSSPREQGAAPIDLHNVDE